MFCNNCGHENQDNSNFCSACGTVLAAEQPSADTTVTFSGGPADTEPEAEIALPLEGLEEGKAILVVKRGPDAGTRFLLEKEVVGAGRDPECDIFLDDVTVSRKHAEIRREGNTFSLVDLGSLNGTFVNHGRVESVPLHNGDELQIGKFKLAFYAGGTPSA